MVETILWLVGSMQAAHCLFDFADLAAGYSPPDVFINWFDVLPLNTYSSQAAFAIREIVPGPLSDGY